MKSIEIDRNRIFLLLDALADVNKMALAIDADYVHIDMPNPQAEYESLRDAIAGMAGSLGYDIDGDDSEVSLCEKFIKELIVGLVEHHNVSYVVDEGGGKFVIGGASQKDAPKERRIAPWGDFRGNTIFEGDVIEHPDGIRGKVVFVEKDDPRISYESVSHIEWTDGDRWRVDYGDGNLSRLCIQIGDKGMAAVVSEWELKNRV